MKVPVTSGTKLNYTNVYSQIQFFISEMHHTNDTISSKKSKLCLLLHQQYGLLDLENKTNATSFIYNCQPFTGNDAAILLSLTKKMLLCLLLIRQHIIYISYQKNQPLPHNRILSLKHKITTYGFWYELLKRHLEYQ